MLFASPATALTRIGSSDYGVSVNLSVANIVKAAVLSSKGVGHTTAPSYNLADQVLSLNVATLLGTNSLGNASHGLTTGLITSKASSPYEGLGTATATGTANSVVNNLALGLTTTGALGATIHLLSLGATTLRSTASVSGVNGLSRSGTANLTGLTISGLGIVNIDAGLFLNPNPNTVLLDLLGIKITLNEQTSSTVSSKLMTSTNAMHILYTNVGVNGGFLNGSIIIGHAQAYIQENSSTATPEPATWVQMIFGFGLIGVFARRRALRAANA